MLRQAVLPMLLLLAGCGAGPRVAGPAGEAADVECAPFARLVSGLQLYGDAASWWDQAEGRYPRGPDPAPGAVLVFQRSARLPSGHVSVVATQVSPREIHVTQANWVHHRITRDEPVVDVSAGNDWTAVRVWWAPIAALGSTVYPAYGFVGPANGFIGPADGFIGPAGPRDDRMAALR